MFPAEQETISQFQESQESPKSPEDKLIAKYIETIKREIETLKNTSQDTKKQEELLVKLTIAQATKGPAGIFFKLGAIKSLKDIPEITQEQAAQYQEAQDAILKECEQTGFSKDDLQKIQEGLTKGDPNIVINEIIMSKIKGINTNRLEQLIFGKEMTEEELLNLNPDAKMKALWEKYKKFGKGFLLILLISLFGVGADFGKSITSER